MKGRDNKGKFVKGHIPWLKGNKWIDYFKLKIKDIDGVN